MCKTIEEILGNEEALELRENFNNMVMDGSCNISDIDNLLMDYGLEPDYIEQLLW